ncbi:hypothetical protein ASPZODRAFT_23266 [Penicilliopsis zonata CBS 506.65]|uniref:Uncharacterized protein n=1 Tax=Penicilliopsis zonata CBS 506.65 TaxID=1073090 RepID=A0A1L9SPE4_9EURO|nr:hypothetical protein ASPZODRAFT_23266 [Penicilliopsis zonata CBS 506.65]OJJ48981.1 hypothetical protein ASPZODRAFT_23266 [Penicilliopsis zonata CBS 506.65]
MNTMGATSPQRDELRAKYQAAAESILQRLSLQFTIKAFNSLDLFDLGVDLLLFNPFDEDFLASKKCLFRPLPQGFLADYFVDSSKVLDGACKRLQFPDYWPPSDPTRLVPVDPTREVYSYLKIHYRCMERKRPKGHLKDLSKWDSIGSVTNPFPKLPVVDADYSYERPYPSPLPFWDYLLVMQPSTEKGDTVTAMPPIQLIISNNTTAEENELLHGELGPIVQAVHTRLNQPGFEKTSFFPVQVLSLFEPRHGRILQARFQPSGRLVVRASNIWSFEDKRNVIDLFLRFWVSEPCDAEDYEFSVDEDSLRDLSQVLSVLSPRPAVDLFKAEEDSSSPGSLSPFLPVPIPSLGKENVHPRSGKE